MEQAENITLERFMDRRRVPLQFIDMGEVDGKYVSVFIINGINLRSEIDSATEKPDLARTEHDQKILYWLDLSSVEFLT